MTAFLFVVSSIGWLGILADRWMSDHQTFTVRGKSVERTVVNDSDNCLIILSRPCESVVGWDGYKNSLRSQQRVRRWQCLKSLGILIGKNTADQQYLRGWAELGSSPITQPNDWCLKGELVDGCCFFASQRIEVVLRWLRMLYMFEDGQR